MQAARRAWVPERLEAAIGERLAHVAALSADTLEAELLAELAAHERLMDRECLNLYAGTNLVKDRKSVV